MKKSPSINPQQKLKNSKKMVNGSGYVKEKKESRRVIKLWVFFLLAILSIPVINFLWLEPMAGYEMAVKYLNKKYKKDFIIKGSYNWATWIEPKGYSGTAKVKDGSDDVEFRVGCITQDQSCVDYYLETSWARAEEKRIRKYLGSDLHEKIKIEVDITPKNKEYDNKAQVSDFDYYIAKHGDDLIKKMFITFVDYDGVSDIESSKKIIKSVNDYLKNKHITVKNEFNYYLRIDYRINTSDDYVWSCDFNVNEGIEKLNTCFTKTKRGWMP